MKKNKIITKLIITFLIIIFVANIIVIYININKKEEPEPINKEVVDNIDYKLIQNEMNGELTLEVNGNKIMLNESNFLNINQVKDIILVNAWSVDYGSIYAIDKNGNIILNILGNCIDNNSSIPKIKLKGCTGISYKVMDNDIYITSNLLVHDPKTSLCIYEDNKIVEYTEKISYLGNNKFSKSIITNKVTSKEFIKNHKINCK